MKTTIIAEKPSVAKEIACIVGASHKEDGFLSGNDYMEKRINKLRNC
jgi:DNA topoisomerase-3